LEQDHGDGANLTTNDLQAAADVAGIDLPHAIANIVLSLSHFDPDYVAKDADVADLAAYRLVKSGDEQRFTLGVAYPAMKADAQRAADGYRDFISPEALEKTAWTWLTKSRDVNLFHSGDPAHAGHFTPTESYIWRGPDWEVPSPVDGKCYKVCKGDWMLGGVWDTHGWSLVKAGRVNGWSPEGGAKRRIPTAARLAQLRSI
jgi:hypothetical protein